jgi:hypothetical protein
MTVRGPRSKVPNGCAIAQRLNHHEAHEGSEINIINLRALRVLRGESYPFFFSCGFAALDLCDEYYFTVNPEL